MQRAQADLRPLTTPEVLDAAVTLTAGSWARYLALSSVGTVPLAALTLGYSYWYGTLSLGQDAGYWAATTAWAGAMAAAWVWHSVARGALTAAVLADVRGQRAHWADVWRSALGEKGSLAMVGAVSTAVVTSMSGCLLFPGLLPLGAWGVARPVVVEERRRFVAALQRSAELTHSHRGRVVRLWLLMVLAGFIAGCGAYTLGQLGVAAVSTFFGYDMAEWKQALGFHNASYMLWLFVVLLCLLEPLKTCADTVLYLDLRIRREGADLHERLRRAAQPALVTLLLALAVTGPASAMEIEEYRANVQRVRSRLAASPPGKVDQTVADPIATATVKTPDSRIPVDNRWLQGALRECDTPAEKEAILSRLDALEETLGPGVQDTPAAEPPVTAATDPQAAFKSAIARPEFKEVASRPEFDRLASEMSLDKSRTWFQRLSDWIEKNLLRQRQRPPSRAPSGGFTLDPVLGRKLFYGLLAIIVAILLALILKALFQHLQERGRSKAAAAPPPALEESLTENALDYSVDAWEQFAQEWLKRGDLRQAVRALYLALLVDLHQQRVIDYNRAFTNWHYVRQFRGAPDQRLVMRGLTEVFDTAWYGRRQCSMDEFSRFQGGVRSLVSGTPPPQSPAHA